MLETAARPLFIALSASCVRHRVPPLVGPTGRGGDSADAANERTKADIGTSPRMELLSFDPPATGTGIF